MFRKLQATADIVVAIPLIKKDGSQATGLTLSTLSTKIIKPDGTALTGYTEATFTEPNSDGVYVCKFPANAATKAFTLEDQPNPYTLTLDSSTADVEPTSVSVWIVSKYPWELALEATLTAIKGAGWTTETLKAIKEFVDGLPADPASNTQVATRASQTSVNAIPQQVWGYAERTLTSIAAVAADVWSYATRKLTSRNISAGEDIACEQTILSSIATGTLQSRIATTGAEMRIKRGDTKTLTLSLSTDWNLQSPADQKVYLCLKADPKAANSTAIVNRTATVTGPQTAEITLTSIETATVGKYDAEWEVRKSDDTEPQTAQHFTLVIEQDVRQ
ncbi:MAG: hypothetical protein Q8J64_06600 [Thermodesulfovibrionales bacterium]|nr:hypothetical protein [Thermodesulfovibrionales bacterium]